MSSDIDVLSEFVDVAPFATEVSRHPKSVLRWMNAPNGLPYVKLGNRRVIHLPTARSRAKHDANWHLLGDAAAQVVKKLSR